jgi:hypothetical protein
MDAGLGNLEAIADVRRRLGTVTRHTSERPCRYKVWGRMPVKLKITYSTKHRQQSSTERMLVLIKTLECFDKQENLPFKRLYSQDCSK